MKLHKLLIKTLIEDLQAEYGPAAVTAITLPLVTALGEIERIERARGLRGSASPAGVPAMEPGGRQGPCTAVVRGGGER